MFDPVRAACRVLDYNQSVRSLAASTLGSILGTYTLSALLSERWAGRGRAGRRQGLLREEIATTVMKTFRKACDPWGVTVERVEVNLFYIIKCLLLSVQNWI